MTYKIEFPDYDDTLSFPEGWIDDSWHNDVCPKFIKDNIMIWCDYKDFDRREIEGQQFIVSHGHDVNLEPIKAFDSLSDALAFAQTQFTQPSQTEIMGTTYIQSTSTYESGGNCSVDFIHLKDGRVLGVSGDCVVLYDNMEDFHSFETKDRQYINLAKD
jgi:hypothetical protein